MHYYQFNIGDYLSHTKHLDLMEDLAYRRLLDLYYLHERPLNSGIASVARQIGMRDHENEVKSVLEEFFHLSDDGWINHRADKEIKHFHSKIDQASRAGKASAERRSNGGSTDVQLTNNQEPITNNHIKESKDSLSAGLPTCPHQDILNLYKKHLPQLAQPRVWDGVRQTNLRQRWLQAAKPSIFSPKGYSSQAEGLAWWDSFFGYIANDTKLAQGFETKDRTWRPDLVWIVNANNFAKIIDGKYQK
jgi:uncharacterized protein YdaU (DUF1376 family)